MYAVDVGYGQFDYQLRADPRVVVLERTNIRSLSFLPERPEICTIDVSFISLRIVVPAVARLLDAHPDVVALVKPQFEAGRESVGRGVVRSPEVWRQVIEDLTSGIAALGWQVAGLIVSPIKGAAGNVEFLVHLKRGPGEEPWEALLERALAGARSLA